ncbi:MAG TPA: hypothetical protein VNT76_01595, partial [Candidatus Binatus sp.]|nr:hypothetical protein [Candidatus Binatus sp.]
IIGPNGSGTAETWRIIRSTNESKYGNVEIDHRAVDIDSASIVMDSDNTCMLWVSGLNSSDMVAANELSIRNHNKPMLRLLTIDDNALALRKSSDGNPQYKRRAITPHPPADGHPALYDHLISGANVDVLVVRAVLMMRADYRDALKTKLGRFLRAIGDAQPIIWSRVNPAAD